MERGKIIKNLKELLDEPCPNELQCDFCNTLEEAIRELEGIIDDECFRPHCGYMHHITKKEED